MPPRQPAKDEVAALTERFLSLAQQLDELSAQDRVQAALRRYQSGLFRLVVVGEIKKGKSSFINALLGHRDLLPALSDVATSTVFKVMYGEQVAYKVFFLPQDAEHPRETTPEPIEVSHDDVALYGTERGNPNNEKRVDFIGVQLPHPWLRAGLMIIDTPGLGGLFRHHADITWRFLPSADATFFVLDSQEAVVSQDEADFMVRLHAMTSLLFFVQTKTDLVKPEQWQAWRERNLTIIADTLQTSKDKCLYFPVSAELKHFADDSHSPEDLNESGFIPLLDFMQNRLFALKQARMAQILLTQIDHETRNLYRSLDEQRRIVTTQSREQLDTLEQAFLEEKRSLDQWQAKEYPRIMRAFQDACADLKSAAQDALQSSLDPSPLGPVIRPLLETARGQNMEPEKLAESADVLQSACLDQCNNLIFQAQGEYNRQMAGLINQTLRNLGAPVPSFKPDTDIREAIVPKADLKDLHFSGFERLRSNFFGGSAGSSIAFALAQALFPPAALIASVVGGLAGSLYTMRDNRIKGREQVVAKLQGVLADTVRLCQRQALHQFNSIAIDFERRARDAFEETTAEIQRDLKGKLSAITETRQRTQASNHAETARLVDLTRQCEALLTDIKHYLEPLQRAA